MKTKKVISIGLAAMMSFTALTCSAATAYAEEKKDEVAGGEDVTISIMGRKVEIHDAMLEAADRYMELHPNVTVVMETVGGGDDYDGTLKTRLNGGNMPTIFTLQGPQNWDEWGENMEDLSDQPWVPYMTEAAAEGSTNAEGKVLGLPYSMEGYGYVYNKKIFEAAGIDGESLKTYEEIDTAFSKLKTMIDNGDLKDEFPDLEAVMDFPVKENWITGCHTINTGLNQEFPDENAAYEAKELKFTNAEELKQIIDFQVKYTAAADNPVELLSGDYSQSVGGGLAIERVAVLQQGNWINTEMADVNPEVADNLGIIPIPLGDVVSGKLSVGVPCCYNVYSGASDAEKEAAKDFLNWLFQSDEGKDMVVHKMMSVPAFSNYDGVEPEDALGKVVKKYLDEGNTTAWVFNALPAGFGDVFGNGVQAYVSGEKTWDEVVSDCKDAWSKARSK